MRAQPKTSKEIEKTLSIYEPLMFLDLVNFPCGVKLSYELHSLRNPNTLNFCLQTTKVTGNSTNEYIIPHHNSSMMYHSQANIRLVVAPPIRGVPHSLSSRSPLHIIYQEQRKEEN